MVTKHPPTEMGRRRALLTDRERELLRGDHDTDKKYVYQAVARVRNKIQDELPEDIEVIRQYDEDLLGDLQEVACDE